MRRAPALYILLLIFLFAFKRSNAQQDPMYSMYLFDKMLINPAFTGSSNWAVGTLKHRDQYMGLNGRPVTQTFNFHTPLQKQHLGIGLKLVNDKVGITTTMNAAIVLSYHLNFAGGKLSFGIEGGMFNRKTDYRKVVLATRGDNLIPATAASAVSPDASAGFYFQKKQFYMGLADYHLLNNAFQKRRGATGLQLAPHLYFIIGNAFEMGRNWNLEPSILVKHQPSGALQADLNLMSYFYERIGIGFQYRTEDAAVAMLRIHITEGFRIAYAYDMTVSKLATFGKNTHELIVSYGIKLLPPPREKEIHPRYYF